MLSMRHGNGAVHLPARSCHALRYAACRVIAITGVELPSSLLHFLSHSKNRFLLLDVEAMWFFLYVSRC